jgi:5-methylcytosine-specific restriction protein B
LGKDYMIGHAYFMKCGNNGHGVDMESFKRAIWNDSINPLLEEYLRGSRSESIIEQYKKIFLDSSNED